MTTAAPVLTAQEHFEAFAGSWAPGGTVCPECGGKAKRDWPASYTERYQCEACGLYAWRESVPMYEVWHLPYPSEINPTTARYGGGRYTARQVEEFEGDCPF